MFPVPAEEARAALALASVPGLGPAHFQRFLTAFSRPSAVFAQPVKELERVGGLRTDVIKRLKSLPDWREIDAQLTRLEKEGGRLLVLGMAGYPALLSEIPGAPIAVFVLGEENVLNQPGLAIVGTRHPDEYGERVTQEFSSVVAAHGVPIVSGLARGIDQAAHVAALDAGGTTIAVLGCGLDVDYPSGSGPLKEKLMQQGAVISEFGFGTPPLPANFRQRNRIISGLSRAVLLVQGGLRSGAKITVNYALEQGREVLCVPGPIYSERSAAPHLFLRQGAVPITSSGDLLEALGLAAVSGRQEKSVDVPSIWNSLSQPERSVLEALSTGSALHRDEVAARSGLDASDAALILLRLELNGLLRAQPGGHYTRN